MASSGLAATFVVIAAEVRSNLGATVRNPATRILLVLQTFYYVLVGSLDLLCVVLAVSVLHIGPGGAGYLNAALGEGHCWPGW